MAGRPTACADACPPPVDCVSHNAVAVVKRVYRQIGKPYVASRAVKGFKVA